MGVFSGALWKPVGNHSGKMSGHLGLIMHSQEGEGSLAGYFNENSSQVSSTFWAGKDSTLEQYVDTDYTAWAQAEGNGTYNSIEFEGYTTEALTEGQIQAAAKVYRYLHDEHGVPFSTTDTPGQGGLGWHGMGGAAWGNHPGCPGDLRKSARGQILQIAQGAVIAPVRPSPSPGVSPTAPKPSSGSPTPTAPLFPGRLLQYIPGKADVTGNDVRMWQQQMSNRGWSIGRSGSPYGAVDGDYGPKSEELCKAFQGNQGLTVDGIVGPITWKATWDNPITHP